MGHCTVQRDGKKYTEVIFCDRYLGLCGAEIWTLWKVDQKYLENFEMCWRRMEEISWTYRVRNEEVLQRSRRRGISYKQ
jgi:hypothetical protein